MRLCWSFIVLALFCAAIVRLADEEKALMLIAGLYGCVSLYAFILYARDKAAAKTGRPRTPENTLHLIGLIGGWPGALLAQSLLRHKTRKVSFQIVFWLTVFANAALAWWLSRGMSLIV